MLKQLLSGFAKNQQAGESAWDKINQGAILIDVRSPAEFSAGAVPNAYNHPLETLPHVVAGLQDKSQAIVVYCLSGGRAQAAASIFNAAGFTDVTNGGGVQSLLQSKP